MAPGKIDGKKQTTATIASGFTSPTNVVQKDGHVVCLNIEVSGTIGVSGYTTVATLPSGFRPPATIVKAYEPVRKAFAYLRIRDSGQVDIFPTDAAISSAYIVETFMV